MSVFSYQASKDDTVRISWNGRVVTTLRGPDAAASSTRPPRGDEQLVMAKATGNFKRGNER